MKHTIKGKRAFSNDQLVEYIKKTVALNSTVLDLGCGPKLYSNPLKPQCKSICTVDAWDWVEPDIVADLETTPLKDIVQDDFDYVLMLDFIEHLDKQAGLDLIKQVKQQCRRKIILLTPMEEIWTENHENVDNPELWCHGNQYDIHKSLWTPADFEGFSRVFIPGFEDYYIGVWNNDPPATQKRILTILGTRPEIIRLSRIIPKLDELCVHRVLHTGQNYDATLNDIFFDQLGLRKPDCVLESKGTIAQQLATTFVGVEEYINEFKPDAVLVLGDTNSGLSAIVCERMGIPVYHMEAGNRCYDLLVPEEKNRRLIDSISTVNLPYTELSRENLLREGATNNRVVVTGNPIKEVLDFYKSNINKSNILQRLGLTVGQYIIATAHRAENVDNPERLKNIFAAFEVIAQDLPIVFSCHPKTRQRLESLEISVSENIKLIDPVGFFDFVKLEQNSALAISDSGTVQEEMCLFGIPTITIRSTTERPETVWCGSNLVTGLEQDQIVNGYHAMKNIDRNWTVPAEYAKLNVSDTVVNILMSKRG
jgi:UDP-N-acetylglucosamine 2-epimerase (non-hydrolysing)